MLRIRAQTGNEVRKTIKTTDRQPCHRTPTTSLKSTPLWERLSLFASSSRLLVKFGERPSSPSQSHPSSGPDIKLSDLTLTLLSGLNGVFKIRLSVAKLLRTSFPVSFINRCLLLFTYQIPSVPISPGPGHKQVLTPAYSCFFLPCLRRAACLKRPSSCKLLFEVCWAFDCELHLLLQRRGTLSIVLISVGS